MVFLYLDQDIPPSGLKVLITVPTEDEKRRIMKRVESRGHQYEDIPFKIHTEAGDGGPAFKRPPHLADFPPAARKRVRLPMAAGRGARRGDGRQGRGGGRQGHNEGRQDHGEDRRHHGGYQLHSAAGHNIIPQYGQPVQYFMGPAGLQPAMMMLQAPPEQQLQHQGPLDQQLPQGQHNQPPTLPSNAVEKDPLAIVGEEVTTME